MRRILFTGFFGLSAFMSQHAFAAFSIDELNQATKLATTAFVSQNATHLKHFTGCKSWLSGDDSKVKVYVNHDGMNMEFNYLCTKQDAKIECHAQ